VRPIETSAGLTAIRFERVAAGRDINIRYYDRFDAREFTQLATLLKKVRQFWIEGLLEKSIHTEVLFDLGKETVPTAIEHPWAQVLEISGNSHELPKEKRIAEVFGELGNTLLILGEPGAGKTISLLELARDLISKAEQQPDEPIPIPVVFNLSSWRHPNQPLSNWLLEELRTKYQIPKRFGRRWLRDNRLLLLLDSLDEVKGEYRADCVRAINEFLKDVGVPGIAVCSRSSEYMSISDHIKFNGAIRLLPLSLTQVDQYLLGAGTRLAALRKVFHSDHTIRELATSPLMLDVMCLSYQDSEPIDLHDRSLQTKEEHLKHLLDTYVKRMFERKGNAASKYDRQQVTHYLGWLAHNMESRSQSIFLVEDLQPSWLSNKQRRDDYYFLSRLITALVLGMVLFLASGPIFVTEAELFDSLVMMPITILAWGLVSGGIVGLIDLHESKLDLPHVVGKQLSTTQVLKKVLKVGVLASFFAGVIGVLTAWDDYWLNQGLVLKAFGHNPITSDLPIKLAATGGAKWLREALILGLTFGSWKSVRNISNDIQTFETIGWAGTGLRRNVVWGALVGLCFALVGVLVEINGWMSSSPRPSLSGWLLGWSIPALIWIPVGAGIGVIVGGLKGTIVDEKSSPNQGMILTIKNAHFLAFMAAIGGFVTGAVISNLVQGLGLELSIAFGMLRDVGSLTERLTSGLMIGFKYVMFGGFGEGVGWGLMAAIAVALRFGGVDSIRHYVLRWMLHKDKCIPDEYEDFLDNASNLVFLRKVGGGYMFIHQLLLAHFSRLYDFGKHPVNSTLD